MTVGLTANSVTTTTASLSWRSDTNHVSYALQYRKAGTASWQSATPTTDTSQTLTQLEAGTVYEAYILANCSSGSVPCLSITFSTASFWQENDYGDFYTGSSSARVGIGTTAPVTQLHVKGGLLLEGNTVFPVGSWWVYVDSVSGRQDSVMVYWCFFTSWSNRH